MYEAEGCLGKKTSVSKFRNSPCYVISRATTAKRSKSRQDNKSELFGGEVPDFDEQNKPKHRFYDPNDASAHKLDVLFPDRSYVTPQVPGAKFPNSIRKSPFLVQPEHATVCQYGDNQAVFRRTNGIIPRGDRSSSPDNKA